MDMQGLDKNDKKLRAETVAYYEHAEGLGLELTLERTPKDIRTIDSLNRSSEKYLDDFIETGSNKALFNSYIDKISANAYIVQNQKENSDKTIEEFFNAVDDYRNKF